MNRVVFEAAYPAKYTHPMHREVVERDALSRASVLTWGPVGSATTLTFFDAGPAVVADVLAGVDAVAERSLVADDGGTYAFVRQTEYAFADPLLDLVVAADAAFLPPLTFHGDRTARFEAVGDAESLAAFHEDLSAVLGARIASVHDFHHGDAPAALTDRRRSALTAALDCGYYDVPRTGSVADVAAELDCAASTAGELLREAEAAVVRDAVGGR